MEKQTGVGTLPDINAKRNNRIKSKEVMKLFDPSNHEFEDDDDDNIMELDIKTPPSTTKDNTSDRAAFG